MPSTSTATPPGSEATPTAERAYAATAQIRFDGMQYRKDIGYRAFNRR